MINAAAARKAWQDFKQRNSGIDKLKVKAGFGALFDRAEASAKAAQEAQKLYVSKAAEAKAIASDFQELQKQYLKKAQEFKALEASFQAAEKQHLKKTQEVKALEDGFRNACKAAHTAGKDAGTAISNYTVAIKTSGDQKMIKDFLQTMAPIVREVQLLLVEGVADALIKKTNA